MPPRTRTLRAATVAAVLALGTSLLASVPQAGAAQPEPAAVTDHCQGQCADILPPGENGNATLVEILGNKAFGTHPAHSDDQLDRYNGLVAGHTGLTDQKLTDFFNDASFGVPANQVESVTQPREDVTITRDKKTGVPHIKGTTRYGTEYGAGFAAGQDRLWLMDLFRHIGRGELTSFAGGALANQGLEQQFWPQAPYTEADLEAQVERIRTTEGARGEQAMADAQAYIDGINAYREKSKKGRYFPGEYVLTGKIDSITNVGEIQPFKLTDLISIASVVGGQFGGGGGGEVQAALSLLAAQQKYGLQEGTRVWESFRQRDDPEAVLTIHDGTSFPYAGKPDQARGTALPDAGSVTPEPLIYDRTGSAGTNKKAAVDAPADLAPAQGIFDDGVIPEGSLPGTGDGAAKRGMSNALVVSGEHTASGNPVAVFGPQTGYFAPQLMMLQELQGPGISARGVSFAGVGMYIQMGRGQDYAWSATSAAQDITDTYAVELCEPDGSAPSGSSTHYLSRGVCAPMEKMERTNSWKPTVADSTAKGSYRMQVWRTDYGIVTHRATVGGKPVAYTSLRTTYRHEADSIIGFQLLNDPAYVTDAASFQQAASHIDYAFNWFYADSRTTAYYNSGMNPVRAPGVDAALPVKAEKAYEWRGFDPAANTTDYTPFAEHPHSSGQDYYISWNNRQAKDYAAAAFGFGAVHRGDLLDDRVAALVADGQVTRASLTRAMEEAALTDLRGEQLLPELLKVIRSQPVTDPALNAVVQQLDSWRAAGAQRKETAEGSHTYTHADAVRIMDAWWPKLVEAEFRPGLGDDLYGAFTASLATDESPAASHGPSGAHSGSAFQYGWWGFADKDLRQVLGQPVRGPLAKTYCGDGDLGACRDALLTTLKQAAAVPATTVYPGDDSCKAGEQWCGDAIVHRPLGGIGHKTIHWQNRPTYQQVVEFPSHR
ncbi:MULTISPECIES: penicillin acylase family protein [unclassified Streptomyces]|uniref:penicillin acylase family protein n=1 Tax=unclassified Streptomyces TaxID=2593676 RepID=UPI0001C1C4E9|nr:MULTISPECIES: penicillin acylase family protein [unclassified Streptomyces]AEN09062.1 peptidase S45 penicillin amidase [Streptomyces sp. SirexAA-E]MYR68909.1 penicillin acylase family protein [Streptomyces sp. SID4939]MYS01932.1 penicillin acylase family protein [Streptomyces sp. SID4940]MYT62514.1 penicillin acylase family protein [Streptomyces sp. SID8357]MYT85516.1 penicillin acylase family protein [Streptomyces sp. SID8360]